LISVHHGTVLITVRLPAMGSMIIVISVVCIDAMRTVTSAARA